MGRRERLPQKMRASPGNIRFAEVEALLRCEGFDLHLESLQKLNLPWPQPKHHFVVQND
jgi:hypothetical protein